MPMLIPDSVLERMEGAHVVLGNHTEAKIMLLVPGFFQVSISEDGGQNWAPMMNGDEICYYSVFSEALQALIELVQEW